jgi:hypothetical protein
MPKWKVWAYIILGFLFINFIYFIAANVFNVKTAGKLNSDITFLKI